MTRRLLDTAAGSLEEHRHLLGPLPWRGSPGLLRRSVEAAGLTGRGGAGFPTWVKMAAVAQGHRPVVVANGAEGEPASGKDRMLLMRSPHLVLDGLQLAAEDVGADTAYVYVGDGAAHESVVRAAAERAAARADRVPVEVVRAPDGFVTGQETAVVAALEGRPAVPRDQLRRITEQGVQRRPTLVQNVETLAQLALLARRGAAWFRTEGTATEPGTVLATVSGAVRTPSVVEVAHGTPIGAVLDLAGGPTEAVQAVLVGGFHGTWLPGDAVAAAPLSREGLAPWGAGPGAGVLRVLGESSCGLREIARIAGYLAGESARSCGPCLNGLPRIATTLQALAGGPVSPGLPLEVERLSRLVEGRGACHHPDGTVRMVRSGLRVFEAEVAHHLGGRCTAAPAPAGQGRAA